MGLGIDTGLKRVAPSGAQPLRQRPVGAAAGEPETEIDVGRRSIVHAAGKAEVVGVTLFEPTAGSPFLWLVPPNAEPQELQR